MADERRRQLDAWETARVDIMENVRDRRGNRMPTREELESRLRTNVSMRVLFLGDSSLEELR